MGRIKRKLTRDWDVTKDSAIAESFYCPKTEGTRGRLLKKPGKACSKRTGWISR